MAKVNAVLTAKIAWWLAPSLWALLPYWLIRYGGDIPENEPLMEWLLDRSITVRVS